MSCASCINLSFSAEATNYQVDLTSTDNQNWSGVIEVDERGDVIIELSFDNTLKLWVLTFVGTASTSTSTLTAQPVGDCPTNLNYVNSPGENFINLTLTPCSSGCSDCLRIVTVNPQGGTEVWQPENFTLTCEDGLWTAMTNITCCCYTISVGKSTITLNQITTQNSRPRFIGGIDEITYEMYYAQGKWTITQNGIEFAEVTTTASCPPLIGWNTLIDDFTIAECGGGEDCEKCVRVSFTYEGENYTFDVPRVSPPQTIPGNPTNFQFISALDPPLISSFGQNLTHIALVNSSGNSFLVFRYNDEVVGSAILNETECPFGSYPNITYHGNSSFFQNLTVTPCNPCPPQQVGTLEADCDCSIGEYTITNENLFTSFEVEACETIFRLNSCFGNQVVYTDTDLTEYVGKVVTIEGFDHCFLVSVHSEVVVTQDVKLTGCYTDCEECSKLMFRLRDCQGHFSDIISTDPRLEQLVGKVIKLPFKDKACFTVTRIPYQYNLQLVEHFTDFSSAYNTCIDCYDQGQVEPNYDVCGCSEDKVSEISCKFVELMYQKMMSRRLGIKYCCEVEEAPTTIAFNRLQYELMCETTPPLPEPEVEECCLQTDNTCQPVNCVPCQPTVSQQVQTDCCNCESSGEASPHDCHKYTVTITSEQLALATGNENNNKNGKLFFGYFDCKKEKVTTIQIKEPSTKQYCVLGIPILGYFTQENFVAIPLTRGDICEPQNTNCNCN